MEPKPPMLWEDVPDYLRLDPARIVSIYSGASYNTQQRIDTAIDLYFNDNGCTFASNSLMAQWGFEFYEKCRSLPMKRQGMCYKHLKMIGGIYKKPKYKGPIEVIRGETDPDKIEFEWANLSAQRGHF